MRESKATGSWYRNKANQIKKVNDETKDMYFDVFCEILRHSRDPKRQYAYISISIGRALMSMGSVKCHIPNLEAGGMTFASRILSETAELTVEQLNKLKKK